MHIVWPSSQHRHHHLNHVQPEPPDTQRQNNSSQTDREDYDDRPGSRASLEDDGLGRIICSLTDEQQPASERVTSTRRRGLSGLYAVCVKFIATAMMNDQIYK